MTDPIPDPPPEKPQVDRDKISEHAKTVNDASVAMVRQLAILWEAQINIALAADNAEALHNAVMRMPVAFTDTNCGCGGGGGTAYLG